MLRGRLVCGAAKCTTGFNKATHVLKVTPMLTYFAESGLK